MAPPVPPDLLPGTLDLLVLRLLAAGPMHGYGIAQRLKQVSGDVLQVGESSLYPSLQRLLLNGDLDAEWGASLAAGDVKPVIDRTYPLSQIVEALRYFDDGRARGKVIVVPD